MPVNRWLGCLALVCVAGIAACSDSMGPSSSVQKKPTSPVGASFSRYILISGAWTCVEGCDDEGAGPDQKIEGLPAAPPDSNQVPLEIPPADSSQVIPVLPVDSTTP
jgi:hypothetical protein